MGAVARRATKTDLICAHWTFVGMRKTLSLAARADAARQACLTQIGWTIDDYLVARAAGEDAGSLRPRVDDCGVRVTELEFLGDWARSPDPDKADSLAWRERLDILLELAAAFGADHVNVGDTGFGGPAHPWDVVVERFAEICGRAAAHDVTICLEFMPWSAIADIRRGWQVVQAAGQPNGKILLDTWHFFRGTSSLDDLAEVPADAIGLIQLNDAGPRVGTLVDDTMYRRLFPGDGEFPLVSLFERLRDMGVDAPTSVEVMSDAVEQLSPAEAVARARASATALYEQCGWWDPVPAD